MAKIDELVAAALQAERTVDIRDQMEQTFGPNPCKSLELINTHTKEIIELTCDRKRCWHCLSLIHI